MESPENEIRGRDQTHAKWILDNNPAITNFTEDDIRRITSNYSTPIGRGGFGEVFRGVLDDENDVVAVKRYIHKNLREDFMTEVSIHSQINHNNAVKLRGFCIGENTLIMVTEYISNGDLDDALHNTDISIPLGTRLGIAVGCAEALSYMHSMHLSNDSLVSVCHGDIKPANILLDANLTAKVADFGLSRSLLGGITQYTKHVKGSLDYMDPIYFQQGSLTPKSDVYSFGAVLLELIARRRVKSGRGSLIGTFSRACAKSRGIIELCDAEIANMRNMKILEEVARLATKCLTLDIDRRPQMNDVVKHLQMLKVRTEGQEETACPFFWEPQNHNIKNFTEQDIERITSNYSTLIGKGGFGEVYKGVIYDGNAAVAVKRYIKQDLREQFMEEVSIHGQINHKNAVKLIGYCIEGNTLMMVTEYISNGNLDDALRNSDISIPLDTRLAIARGCAEALNYMHSMHLSNDSLVCHGDIKPANILLDADLTPKVADFGLSRLLSGGVTRYTSMVKGTLDYMDPIYLREGRLTPKCDIYSFGAVLLELIARKRVKEREVNLIGAFSKACASGEGLRELFDAEIANRTDTKILEQVAKLATECLTLDIDRRPEINYVAEHLRMLQAQMKGQENSAGPFFKGTENHDIKIFTEKDIERITGNYSTPIGNGAFGVVFRGYLDEDGMVAVKRYKHNISKEKFMAEVSIHSQINHTNAVKLIGYCTSENTRMIVTEYISNGNLSDALHHNNIPIPLGTRLGIAIGCAEALCYMHSMHLSNHSLVCHGDIKPANILLDDNLTAKVKNFELSKLLPGGVTHYTVHIHIEGSMHYIDPIYVETGLVTPKSDVYSFGVVLLELIARKSVKEEEVNLVGTFCQASANRRGLRKLFDSEISNGDDIKILEEIARLATECLSLDIDRRPEINYVSEHLRMLQAQMKGQEKSAGSFFKETKNHDIKIFTEEDIEKITANYSTYIGKDDFGEVYRGFLDDEDDVIAVRICIGRDLGEEFVREAFMREVTIHRQINHKNAGKLIGYCIGGNTLAIVTEYFSNGNLDDILHNSDISIPLGTRLGIAIGCAEALSYMHSMHLSNDSLVCHGDIRPANIFLDANFTAKVIDFRLSKLLQGGVTRYTSYVIGTINYIDPIFLREGRITPRSDIYSFGAVLLELIARKRIKEEKANLIVAFHGACAKGKGFDGLFDGEIANVRNVKILEDVAKLATKCLTLEIDRRPQMKDVAKHLLVLWKAVRGGEGNISRRLFKRTQDELERRNGQGTSSVSSSSSVLRFLGISKRTVINPKNVPKLGNVRIFTKGELSEITENYSYLLGISPCYEVYKGTLEDNTLVTVKKYCVINETTKEESKNTAIILSQIVHKNIIRLWGCCLEDNSLVLVCEHAAKGKLSDFLDGGEDFPLELRLKIAAKTAEALAYLHAPATGVILHGSVMPSNIFLDDNFMPKIAGFENSRRLGNVEDHAISTMGDANYIETNDMRYDLLKTKRDVYYFGIVLLELISKNKPAYRDQKRLLIPEFTKAYETDKSGKAVFDQRITAEEDIVVLDEIGRLALKCTSVELHDRPTMKEVAEHLKLLRRNYKTTQSI